MRQVSPISNYLVSNGRLVAHIDRRSKTIRLQDPDLLTEVHVLYPEYRVVVENKGDESDDTPDYRKETQ